MPTDHNLSVAIAQTIFYAPLTPATIYILVKNWQIGPRVSRVPWITLAILSLMRFTGGILVIARESAQYNFRLTMATVVLLNVGLVPLIMSTLGMVGIVMSPSLEKQNWIYKLTIVIRLLFVTALTLLITGGVMSLDGHPIGDSLVQAAYIIFASIISIIIAMIMRLQFHKSKLAPESLIYLLGTTFAIPFLILRIIYAVLSAFLAPSTWSPVVGSAVAFALMALLPEYITILIYTYLGFHRILENDVSSETVTSR